jgi:RNA polymerase sigma-70 factor (ECF subfamily)
VNQLQQAVRRGIEENPSLLYRTARYVLADQYEAEDAAQEAALDALRAAGQYDPKRPIGPWLAGLAYRRAVARLRRKGVRMRLEREAASSNSATPPPPHLAAERDESAELVRRKVQALEQDARTLVALHYFEGFSLREIGKILDLPDSTVGDRLKSALNQLRTALALAGAGLALAAPAALEAALRSVPVEPVPSGLVVRLKDLANGKGPALAGATKGGLVMKIGLGVAAVGLVAGTAFWAVGGGAESPPVAVAEKKPQFDTPAWHPEARWSAKPEPLMGGGGFGGPLDGPRLDVQTVYGGTMSRLGWCIVGGPYMFSSYDPELERLHAVAGSASGVMDGPFSRARIAGPWAYMDEPGCTSTPDGRYLFVTERYNEHVIRRMDLEKQMVVSIPRPKGWLMNIFADNKGRLYVVMHGGETFVCDFDGKVEKKIKLQTPGAGIFLFDAVNDRLYWGTKGGKTQWFLGYFDMKAGDGVFHGVLPCDMERNKKNWMRAVPAPFKDFGAYTQVDNLSFGPDDPERNFIYMRNCDTTQHFRLDLKKEEVWVLTQEPDGFRYIFSGQGKGSLHTWGLTNTGDVPASVDAWGGDPKSLRYPRVK